jgi:hypothetical protein
MSEVDELYERLKRANEPKGYFFGADRERTFELLADTDIWRAPAGSPRGAGNGTGISSAPACTASPT